MTYSLKFSRDDAMTYLVHEDGVTPLVQNSLASPQEIFFESFRHREADAGVTINQDTAMTYSSVFQAVNIISNDVARIALNIFERQPDDAREKRRDHPAFRLLNLKANPYVSGYYFRQTLMAHALLHGNGYARIIRDALARPVGLEILPAQHVEPVITEDKRLVYDYEEGRESRRYSDDEIFHLKGLGDDGIQGYSVIKLAKNSWGMGLAAEKHGNKHFAKGGRPNIVLKTAARLDKQQADNLLENFERRHNGYDGAGKPALASGGLDVVPLNISNSESQWLQSRAFQRVEVASWFSLPPHKLGDSSRMAYSSIEAEERSYVSQTLMRWFKAWEVETTNKLLTQREMDSDWYCEHNVDALIQGDFATQANTAVLLRNAMILTQNEARKKFNLPSVEGGDEFENPATSSGAQRSNQEVEETQNRLPASTIKAHKDLIADRMRQFVKTEITQLQRLAKQSKDIIGSVEKYYESWTTKVTDGLRPCVAAFESLPGINSAANVDDIVANYCDESRQAIAELLASGTPRDLLADEIKELSRSWLSLRIPSIIDQICEA